MRFQTKKSLGKNVLYEEYLKEHGPYSSILELGCGDGINRFGLYSTDVRPGSVIIASKYAREVVAVDRDKDIILRLERRLSGFGIDNVTTLVCDFRDPSLLDLDIPSFDVVNLDPCSLADISTDHEISMTVRYIVHQSKVLFFTIPLPWRGGSSQRYWEVIFDSKYDKNHSSREYCELFSSFFNVSFKPVLRTRAYLRVLKE